MDATFADFKKHDKRLTGEERLGNSFSGRIL